MQKTVAIIQARMGSTRFPGKMLAKLGPFTLMEWVFKRVLQAKLLDGIVLATSTLVRDDPLVKMADYYGIDVFRGSEENVLERFAGASRLANAHNVVRICADNPFISCGEIDRLIDFFLNNACDYACNHQDRLGSHYADGFGAEIMSSSLLYQLDEKVKDVRHREHVTLYLWDHAKHYTLYAVPAPEMLAYPNMRFDVDIAEDLIKLTTLLELGLDIDSSPEEIIGMYSRQRVNQEILL